MDRRFFLLGSLLMLATLALWVSDAAGWIPATADDHWSRLTLQAGMIALAAALLLRLVSKITGWMGQGRCRVCGNRTERGHMFCLDHLQETVNATRDKVHDRTPARP
jgi:hypothetical protein